MKKRDILVNGLVNRMLKLNESLIGFPELVIDGLKERVVSGEINNIQLDGCIRYVRNNHKELMSEFGGVDEAVDYVIEVVGDTSLNMGDQYFPGQTTHVDGNVDDKPFMSEDDEEIPYADQLPDEDNMYEFGKSLYDKTQNILNTVGAKIMNNLTMIEVGSNIGKYKVVLSQLKAFKSELSSGMDNIYGYVEQAGYGSKDPNVKKLDSMYDELDDDLIILGDIKDLLDTMIFTAESLNRNHTKAFKLGMKNVTTDIALRESNGKGLSEGVGYDTIDLVGGIELIRNRDRSIESEDSYDIIDGVGKNLGFVHIVDRGDYFQVANVNIRVEKTGLGYILYKKLISILSKPLVSDDIMSSKVIGLWDKLVNNGFAERFRVGDGFKYRSVGFKS